MKRKAELMDEVERSCRWYRDHNIARFYKGSEGEPAFYGRLMNDRTGAGQGAGTAIVFDVVFVPKIVESFAYDANSLKIPFLLDRAKQNNGLAFVIVSGPGYWMPRLVTEVRTLALGRQTTMRNSFTIYHREEIMDFLTQAIVYCEKPTI